MADIHATIPAEPTQNQTERLAATLADTCVARSFMAERWWLYYRGFLLVLHNTKGLVRQ
jgi:hypothetical protein